MDKQHDDDNYEGHYHDGKMHGQGKFTWADGSVYIGEFFEDDIHGHGV